MIVYKTVDVYNKKVGIRVQYSEWLQNVEIVEPKYSSHGARGRGGALSSINIIIY